MNQKQREFLIAEIEKNYKNQVEELNEQLINAPSLNNYLVAAFLDNSIEFAELNQLREKLRDKVIAFGTEDSLIIKNNAFGRRYQTTSHLVSIQAEHLFVIPQNYKLALSKYNEIRKKVNKQIAELTAHRNTIIYKLNIGSNASLENLITEVDNLSDLSIMNTQFLLTEEE